MFGKFVKKLNIDYKKAINIINQGDKDFFDKGFSNDIQ